MRFEPKIVVENHAARRDGSCARGNEVADQLLAVQMVQNIYRCRAAVGVHIVILTRFVEVLEVRDDRRLLAAEGQIDEAGYILETELVRHCLKLRLLIAPIPLDAPGEEVQFVDVDLLTLQHVQCGRRAVELIDAAVSFGDAADPQLLQHLHAVGVLIIGDGQRDRHLPVFRVIGVTQYCVHSCVSPFLAGGWFLLPSAGSFSHHASRRSRAPDRGNPYSEAYRCISGAAEVQADSRAFQIFPSFALS